MYVRYNNCGAEPRVFAPGQQLTMYHRPCTPDAAGGYVCCSIFDFAKWPNIGSIYTYLLR